MTNQGIRYCYINGQTTTIDSASTVNTCSYSNSGSSYNGGSSGYSGITVNMNYISAGSTYVIYNVQTNVLGYLWGLAVKAPNTTVPWISTFKSQGSSVRTYSTNLTDYYVHIYDLQPQTTYYVYLYAEWDLGWSMPYTSIASYTMRNITTTASSSSSDPTVDIQSVTVGDTYAIYNLLTNAVGYMWTLAVQTPNTTVPWISTFKSQGEMLRLSSSNMTQYLVPIHNLKASTSYYTYVYAEFDDGWFMPYTSIASYTRRNITTLASPTVSPSMSPTKLPTWTPTSLPTLVPSVTPTFIPTVDPTQVGALLIPPFSFDRKMLQADPSILIPSQTESKQIPNESTHHQSYPGPNADTHYDPYIDSILSANVDSYSGKNYFSFVHNQHFAISLICF